MRLSLQDKENLGPTVIVRAVLLQSYIALSKKKFGGNWKLHHLHYQPIEYNYTGVACL